MSNRILDLGNLIREEYSALSQLEILTELTDSAVKNVFGKDIEIGSKADTGSTKLYDQICQIEYAFFEQGFLRGMAAAKGGQYEF